MYNFVLVRLSVVYLMQQNKFDFSAISKFRGEIMGVACIWIILHHFKGTISFYPLSRLSLYGNAGVDIFLFLSGIGLYFTFQKNEPMSLFYKKRFVRLLIPYILICVPFYVWRFLYLGGTNLWLDITQLSFPLSRTILTWYIPAIFVFYLLFPLVYKLQNTKRIQNKTVLVILLSVFYMLLLLIFKKLSPTLYENIEIMLTRFIIFFIGCYFGRAVFKKKGLPSEWVALGFSYTIIWFLIRETAGLPTFWTRLSCGPLAISICIVLSYLFTYLKQQNFLLKVLRFFGRYSLEIYLTHVLIYNVWRNVLGVFFLSKSGIIDYLVVLAISSVLSVPIHFLVEKTSKILLKKD